MKLRLRATGCHLSYGITVLPATWHTAPYPLPARAVFDLCLPTQRRLSLTRQYTAGSQTRDVLITSPTL